MGELDLLTKQYPTPETSYKSQASVVIQNMIVSAKLKETLNLEQIAHVFPSEADYRPEQFPAVFFRPAGTKKMVSIFSSGTMVSAGAKTEFDAQSAIRQVAHRLKDAGILSDDKCETRVQNVVATIDFQRRVHLEKASSILGRAIYEPELFPALVHRSVNPSVCYLLFAKGTAICLGAKSIDTVYYGARKLESMLETGDAFVLN